MLIKHSKSLVKSRKYLYERLRLLSVSGDYHLSGALTQQIQALSTYRYTPTTKGDMSNLFMLLKDAEVADTTYNVAGCTIWLPYGVRYKKQFILQLTAELKKYDYEEYLFPNLIDDVDFKTLCNEIYNFDDQALTVSGHTAKAILKPTGESSVYPVFARWLREGKQLPLRVFQTGPFFRYKSSPHPYLRPVECSFMLEAHGSFKSRRAMLAEYDIAQDICKRWVRLLCLNPYIVSRPITFNRPVSEKTVGFDVVLPNGKTIQTAIAYLQSQVFSKPYDIAFYDGGVKKIAYQITYGITERNIYTSLFVHADDLGLRLPSQVAPEQIIIICRDTTSICSLAADKLQTGLTKRGLRVSMVTTNSKNNVFGTAITKGIPLQVVLDESLAKKDVFELFDRRSLTLKRMTLSSRVLGVLQSTLEKGDEILLEEQTIRKMDYTQTLTPATIAQTHAVPQARNWCSLVAVHEEDACIKHLQTLGFGEYIGTDQSQKLPTLQACCSCGEQCETFGYLTKRL